ncbi:MAG: HAMP domain-containing methyl-accepting chemotaxis protein [Thermoleophilia bacterium]
MVSRVVNLPIGRKIAIVTGSILTLLVVAVLIAVMSLRSASASFDKVATAQKAVEAASTIPREQLAQRSLQAEFTIFADQALLDEFEASAERAGAGRKAVQEAYPDNAVIQAAVKKAEAADALHDPTVFDKLVPAVRAGRTADVKTYAEQARELVNQQIAQGDIILKEVRGIAAHTQSDAQSASTRANVLIGLVGLLALILGAGLSYLLYRLITFPLRDLRDRMWELAEGDGDLTKRIEIKSQDEVGQVAKNFNRFAATVHDIVRLSSQASDGLARNADTLVLSAAEAGEAVAQTAGTVDGMAAATTLQAERVTEVGGLVEDMGITISRAADAGRSVAQVAGEADERAAEGERSIAQVQQAMNSIERSVGDVHEVVAALGDRGREIGAIVQTIGEISAQTNLLALNAAIEAARAGEHGRGFAVVAEEVRKLAEQSQDAVGSIAEIIGDLQQETERAVAAMDQGREEVSQGAQIVEHAGTAFAAIRERVSAVANEVESVSSACSELEQSALSVQDRMSEVAAVSEENAASGTEIAAAVQETSAAADSVAVTAREVQAAVAYLDELVSKFKVWEPDKADRRRRIRMPDEQGQKAE